MPTCAALCWAVCQVGSPCVSDYFASDALICAQVFADFRDLLTAITPFPLTTVIKLCCGLSDRQFDSMQCCVLSLGCLFLYSSFPACFRCMATKHGFSTVLSGCVL